MAVRANSDSCRPASVIPISRLRSLLPGNDYGIARSKAERRHEPTGSVVSPAVMAAAVKISAAIGAAARFAAKRPVFMIVLRQISLSPIGVTMMLCPEESLDSRFLEALDRVRTYFEREGDLLLEAPIDSGTLRFRRPPAD
jgi:hypothetical protein